MQEIFTSLNLDAPFDVVNEAQLTSCFSVSELAASAFAAVGCSISELVQIAGLLPTSPRVEVDQTLASLWFSQSIDPIDWQMPPIWDAIAGDYRTGDGWIKLHTNLDHHRHAALSVIGCKPDRELVAKAVLNWGSNDLETNIINAGGVAAALRSRDQWRVHPQGSAVASEPLIIWHCRRDGEIRQWQATRSRPLNGLRVLDLTRVLAGPVATRTLAGFGAEVLRIDPPGWDEANVVPDITLGKRCANLQLDQSADRETFEALLANADVLIHGYRPGALEGLGYSDIIRQQISPNLIEVSLDAYGWSGPWAERRGFDSLVQMSCGIADTGMRLFKQERPTPLPVQALDHATGYLMAAAAIRLITSAMNGKGIANARLSLARTAEQLTAYPQKLESTFDAKPLKAHFSVNEEATPWGRAKRLRPALNIDGVPMQWRLAASKLGSEVPQWPK